MKPASVIIGTDGVLGRDTEAGNTALCMCVQICILAVTGILKQQKRTKNKVEFDPYELTGSPQPSGPSDIRPGDRPDNECLLYKKESVPRNEEEWNEFTFVEKTHWGYYTWPRSVHSTTLVAEWLACWTQAQKSLGSNHSRDAVG